MPQPGRLAQFSRRGPLALIALLSMLVVGLWLASAGGTEGAGTVSPSGAGRIGGLPQVEPGVCDLPTSHVLDAGNTDVGYFGPTMPVSEALTNVDGTIDRVWFHDRFAAPGTPTWKLWSPRAPAAILGFTELSFGEPYFLFSDEAQVWDFAPRGALTEPTSVQLVVGDNNIVYYGGPLPAAQVPAVSHIWRLDVGADPQAPWGLWAESLPAPLRAFETVEFADSYFINVTAPTQWQFPPCDVAPPPEPEPEPEPEPAVSVAGEWTFTVTVTIETGACSGETGMPVTDPVTITQEGTTLTVVGLGGANDPWVGEVMDGTIIFGGTRPEDGGLTTAVFTMTLSEDGQSLTGNEAWSWAGPGGTCPNSASDVTAVRLG